MRLQHFLEFTQNMVLSTSTNVQVLDVDDHLSITRVGVAMVTTQKLRIGLSHPSSNQQVIGQIEISGLKHKFILF